MIRITVIVLTLATLAFTLRAAAEGHPSVDPPAGEGALAPNLAAIGDHVALTWLEPAPARADAGAESAMRLRFSIYRAGAWENPVTIVEGSTFFANWADIPSFVQAADGTLLAHWLQKSGPGPYAYDVMLARSTDGGATWSPLGKLHDDDTQTEHGFVSLLPAEGGVRAFWLDGRAMSDETSGGEGHGHGDMGLRTALIAEGIGRSTLLDHRVCECCDTSAAMTSLGPVIAYRDRSSNETRDIAVVRRRGEGWSDPRLLYVDDWQIFGCPVNGPAIEAHQDVVVAAWFTDSPTARVHASFSTDAGRNFSQPVVIDDAAPIGRVAVELLDRGEAIVAWVGDDEGGQTAVRLCRVSSSGEAGAPRSVSEISPARASGFPKIHRVGENLLVVWTDAGPDQRLRAAAIPLEDIPPVD